MIVNVQVDGGLACFPGMHSSETLDTETLPEKERERVERWVHEMDFGRLPGVLGELPRGAADMRTFSVTVKMDGGVYRVRVPEPVKAPALSSLIHYLLKE